MINCNTNPIAENDKVFRSTHLEVKGQNIDLLLELHSIIDGFLLRNPEILHAVIMHDLNRIEADAEKRNFKLVVALEHIIDSFATVYDNPEVNHED